MRKKGLVLQCEQKFIIDKQLNALKIFQIKMVKPAVYTVGSTCLAKVRGYPPWPAIVKDIQPGTGTTVNCMQQILEWKYH